MKKVFTFIFLVALSLGFVSSCGNKEEPANKDTANAEQTQPVPANDQKMDNQATPSSVSVDQWLDEYDKFLDEYIPLIKKALAGDAAAAQELQKANMKLQEFSDKTQKMSTNFTPAQQEKALKLAEKAMSILNSKK